MNIADAATPEEFVVAVFTLPANVPDAPLLGTVNVTVTPLTPVPLEFSTVAINGLPKALLMVAVWGVPLVAAMEDGPVLAWLVSAKLAGVETAVALAVTA